MKINNDWVNKLQLDDESKVRLKITDNKIVMEPTKRKIGNQTVSLRWFMIPTIFSCLCLFTYVFLSGYRLIPLVGSSSIASSVIILGSLSGIFSFIFFFFARKKDRIKGKSKDIYWRNFPTILISFVVILVMSLIAFFKVMGLVFKVAGFDLFTATLLFFSFVAMVTNRENQWWQFNFSFLGTSEAKNRWEFNLTLLFSSLFNDCFD